MNENDKILHDIKIIETEDGFTIELKGNKEFLRQWIDRGGAFLSRFGGRGRGPFGEHGPFGHHHGPFGEHGPFGHHHGPFGGPGPFGPDHEPFRGPFGGPGPEQFRSFGPLGDREQREAWKAQARAWRQQARAWKQQMRDLRHQGWNVSPEEREALVQQMQAWREQWPFGQGEKGKRDEQPPRGPFGWRGHREKPKRYDLGPWWDEGESTDELPTV